MSRTLDFLRIICAPFIALSLGLALPAAAKTTGEPAGQPLLLGATWYPEQWPENRWDADLALMQRAHINVTRLNDFGWSTIEPREGDYQLDWLERAIRAAERHGIRVVITTATSGPPAWLTQAYSQTLRTGRDGRLAQHGQRAHFDWSDPKYRELCAKLVTKLAERFGHDPNVIGWQIDNELEDESFGEADRTRFQAWLKAKYKTLDAMNVAWSTAYWSQTYSGWSQVPIPPAAGGNPGLMLNWKLFVTDTWRSYQRVQIDALRAKVDPRQTITTNTLAQRESADQNAFMSDYDFASFDAYVGSGHVDPVFEGAVFDQARGYLQRNFWVAEMQPGFVNWAGVNNSLDRGEVRAMTWTAIGHGADAVSFWQWRSAPNGQEQYHGTLLGADGTPVPIYDEVAQIGAEFAKVSHAVIGTRVVSQVAILNDFPSRWAIGWQRHVAKFDAQAEQWAWYRPLRALTRSVDIVPPEAQLGRYRLMVAPALNRITPEQAKALEAYVRGGGHLLLGVRSGMKDLNNSLWPQRQPGPLAALLGARVEQYYALLSPVPVRGVFGSVESVAWAERLELQAPGVEVLARFGPEPGGWLEGRPAAVTRKVGKGRITYIGANLDDEGLKAAVAWAARISGVEAAFPEFPAGLDVEVREGDGRRVLVLTNYAHKTADLPLPPGARELLTDVTGSVRLAPYGVAVVEMRAPQ